MQTKMSYPLQPKKPKRSFSLKALYGAISIVAIVLIVEFFTPSVFPTVTIAIAKPFWQSKDFLAQAIFGNQFFEDKHKLVEENNTLRAENELLRQQLLSYEVFKSENNEFRKLFSRGEKNERVALTVVAHPAQSPYDIFITDNRSQNIKKDNLVVYGSVALGTVNEVLSKNIKMDLFSSPGRETEARLLKDGTPLVLKGKGMGNFFVVVPRGLDIVAHDLVALPHDESFIVARVGAIEETPTDSFKKVFLTVPINIFSLRFVEVIHEK